MDYNLLEEFKSAMKEAEREDYTIVISSYGEKSELTCIITIPRIDYIQDDQICISNYANSDQFVVYDGYEIKKEEEDGYVVYKIKSDDKVYAVEIVN